VNPKDEVAATESRQTVASDAESGSSVRRGVAVTRTVGRPFERALRSRLSGIIVAIVITAAAFQAANSQFLTVTNLLVLVNSMTTLAILAFGETLVLVSGEIDLSVGATYGLAAMVFGVLWMDGMNIYLALGVALLCGAGVGVFNAFFVNVIKVNSFVVTLGTLNIVQGITLLVSNSASINPSPTLPGFSTFLALGADKVGRVPVQAFWLLGVGALTWMLLHRSVFGFRLAALGGNESAARAAHLPIRRYRTAAFMVAGVCAAIGGLIDFSLVGATDPSSGTEFTFQVFAAVIIGGASLSGGRGSIVGTAVGALFLSMLTNGLSLIGVGTYVQFLFIGGIIIAAVAVDRWTTTRLAATDVQI
jgi:ribose/xylose/arabinose/galactoside ABC-type transport system permease subunit